MPDTTDRVPATGTVHWIGTGLSSGSGLRLLADTGTVTLWGRTEEKASARLAALGLTGRATAAAYDRDALAARLAPGDVVVSMLPASEHAGLLALCLAHRAHFACSSYVSDELAARAPEAETAGLVLLTEAGLDPGIDHLLADLLVDRARAAVGERQGTADFTSWCGGVPAEPNEFRYRFSWAPRGVLTALRSPARYIEDGAERVVDRPWEATRELQLDGETFEAYPNRDSLPYRDRYALPAGWRPHTFVRGTLRLSGWLKAWSEVFAVLRDGDAGDVARLADELAARYPTTDDDRDRVVLAVALAVRSDDGAVAWRGEYLLDTRGDAAESAMARCVSVPLACGITDILTGASRPGLHRAADGAHGAARWLEYLAGHGIDCRFTERYDRPPGART